MGNHKLKWTAEEEEALIAGVVKYGAGKWKNILLDSDFKHKLANRSNVDLKFIDFTCLLHRGEGAISVKIPILGNSCDVIASKLPWGFSGMNSFCKDISAGDSVDKWRNMGGQGSGAIIAVTPRAKSTPTGAPAPKTQNSALVTKEDINGKALQSPECVQNPQKHNEMILEALSSIKDRNGSDFVSIMRFIEKKYEVPQNFRRLMSTKLRKLVIQGKVEKIQKRYKIKHALLGTKTPQPKQKVVRLKPKRESRPSISAEIEEASRTAAHKIAEAEDKSFLAAEAVKESERLSQMAEDADAVVMHLKQLFGQWKDEPDNNRTRSELFSLLLCK